MLSHPPSLRALQAALAATALTLASACADGANDGGPLPQREPAATPESEPEGDAGTPSSEPAPAPTAEPDPSPTAEPAAEPSPSPEAPVDGGAAVVDAGVDGGEDGGGVPTGNLDVDWIAGAQNCNQSDQPPLQVHQYSARTWILRQSKCTHFEGPFIYLLVGDERALLLDTGATQSANQVPTQETIEGILEEHLSTWPGAPAREDFELVVAHTHGHGDHVAGDSQFEGEPQTDVVGTSQNAVQNFFGLDDWPAGLVTYDLGNRVLEILPIPGHQNAHIAVFDDEDGLLLTGDSLYPGNLFIQNFGQYRTSIDDLTVLAAERDVMWVLGTHVEMTSTPGVDYPYGTTYQPNEHVLQLTFAHLVELRDALNAMGNNGQREVHDSFIISP